jgi:hypothetical protein
MVPKLVLAMIKQLVSKQEKKKERKDQKELFPFFKPTKLTTKLPRERRTLKAAFSIQQVNSEEV